MTCIILLSGENTNLALSELKGVLRSTDQSINIRNVDGRLVSFDGRLANGTVSRMGFARFYSDMVVSSDNISENGVTGVVSDVLGSIDHRKSLSVKIISPDGKGHLSRSYLFERFCSMAKEKGFTLQHRSPEQKAFFIAGKKIYSGLIKETTDRISLKSRRGSRMPFSRPIVMEPKLARVMTNLSGLPKGSLILDPFMGPAGLSIEAAHLGYRVIGIERDPEILNGARDNIRSQSLNHRITCYLGDSREMYTHKWWKEIDTLDGIVTDPPFGRSAPLMGEEPASLLNNVLEKARKKMKRGGVLVLDTNEKDILNDINGFSLAEVHLFRVHRSLTRYFARLIAE